MFLKDIHWSIRSRVGHMAICALQNMGITDGL